MNKRYPFVILEVDDHAFCDEGDPSLLKYIVSGLLVGETKDTYFVSPWWNVGSELSDENNDTYAISRGAVTKIRKVKSV